VRAVARARARAGQRLSKYRHVETKVDTVNFTNLRKLNKRLPLETNGFTCSAKWAAVPIEGPGGLVQILDVSPRQYTRAKRL
jgi:hypothetical protein